MRRGIKKPQHLPKKPHLGDDTDEPEGDEEEEGGDETDEDEPEELTELRDGLTHLKGVVKKLAKKMHRWRMWGSKPDNMFR